MYLITVENAHKEIRRITAESVREYIQRHNMSPNWLAVRAGVSSTTIYDWLAGRRNPMERTRLRVAVAMRIADPSVLEDVVPDPEDAVPDNGNGVRA